MKNITLIVLILIFNISLGQTEKLTNKTVTENFIKNYNYADYKAIFLMFSDEMQGALPINETTKFLTGLKSQAGNISKQEFIKFENGTYASYKITFERAVLALNISINDNSKINGLFVKPFVEQISSDTVIDNLSIKNNIITKKQSEIIFEHS